MKDEESIGMDGEFDENCPMEGVFSSLYKLPKPFGIMWERDKMIEFLHKRGYKIINRVNEDLDEEYSVAYNDKSTYIPNHDNINEAFIDEYQDIMMKWALRIAKENDNES